MTAWLQTGGVLDTPVSSVFAPRAGRFRGREMPTRSLRAPETTYTLLGGPDLMRRARVNFVYLANAVGWGLRRVLAQLGRALVSKTSGWGFDSLGPCYTPRMEDNRHQGVCRLNALAVQREGRAAARPGSGEDE